MARKSRYDPKFWLLEYGLNFKKKHSGSAQHLGSKPIKAHQSPSKPIKAHQSPMSQYSVEVQAEPEETIDNVLNKAQEALNVLIVSVVSSSGTLLDITRCDGSRV